MEEHAPRAGRVAFWGVAGALVALSTELVRNDHGLGEPFFWVAFVVAPVVLIFGAAAAGARRWYGWPDLGSAPGRAAILAGAVVAGALAGNSLLAGDLAETRARGVRLARQVREWKDAQGRWPQRLEDLESPPPRTRLGILSPPPFDYDPQARTLAFRVGRRDEVLDVTTEGAAWRRR